MSGQHAFLSPSGADIWKHCSAMPAMAELYPTEATEDTLEGEATHWIMSQTLTGKPVEAVAPNGVVITEEMREAAQVGIDHVLDLVQKYAEPDMYFAVEQRIDVPTIHPTKCWGTGDVVLYFPSRKLMIGLDFKYGHKFVDEYSPQIALYLEGTMTKFGINGHTDQLLNVEMHIVQPRCYSGGGPVRVWKGKASDLRPMLNTLRAQAEEATSGKARAVTGTHCTFCPGRHSCLAARHAAMSSVDYSYRSSPENMSPEAISWELNLLQRAAEAIKTRLSGLEELASAKAKSGVAIPGYGLVPVQGRLAWSVDASVIDKLGQAYGVDLRKPDVFITPTQAKKKGIDESVISAYAQPSSSGMRLEKVDVTKITRILNKGN